MFFKKSSSSSVPDKTEVKKYLEEGNYIAALGLGKKYKPIDIKDKVIQLRELYPDLSIMLRHAEDALVKDPKQHEKDYQLREEIYVQIKQKFGETIFDIFPPVEIWKLIQQRLMAPGKIGPTLIAEIEKLSKGISPLKVRESGHVEVTTFDTCCPDCSGEGQTCGSCFGKGHSTRTLRGHELAEEAKKNPTLKAKVLTEIISQGGSINNEMMRKLVTDPFLFDNILEHINSEVTMQEPCWQCGGSGQYCSCKKSIAFDIPYSYKTGMVVKGKEQMSGKVYYAKLV